MDKYGKDRIFYNSIIFASVTIALADLGIASYFSINESKKNKEITTNEIYDDTPVQEALIEKTFEPEEHNLFITFCPDSISRNKCQKEVFDYINSFQVPNGYYIANVDFTNYYDVFVVIHLRNNVSVNAVGSLNEENVIIYDNPGTPVKTRSLS